MLGWFFFVGVVALASFHDALSAHQSGAHSVAQKQYQELLVIDPANETLLSLLGVSFCQSNNIPLCARYLERAVALNPQDSTAWEYLASTYNFLARRLYANSAGESMKEYQRALQQAVKCFKKSLQQGGSSPASHFAQSPTNVYRALGDALLWLGREDEARALFQKAVEIGLWSDVWCRPALNFALRQNKKCRGPICDRSQFSYFITPFESKLPEIAQEFYSVSAEASNVFSPESAGLHAGKLWKTAILLSNGEQAKACSSFPITCKFVRSFPEVQLKQGQVKFSVMSPGTRVQPHCGPTNNRLRMHCAIAIPEGEVWLKVKNVTNTWREGECFVFDESCEHEVTHRGNGPRVVLLVDFANPDLGSLEDYLAALVPGPSALRRHFGPSDEL